MKKKIFILMISLIAIIAVVSTSYAYLKIESVSDPNKLTLSNFGVILLTDIENVDIDNLYPVEDYEGLLNPPTTFQIQNIETITASYKISLIDNESVPNTLNNSSVRYQLKKTSSLTGTTEILEITNLNDFGILDEGIIEAEEIITYELIMWIDYDVTTSGLSFNKVILVEGMQATANLDKSGANYPELVENMIPVYYEATSETEGVWRKADSKNYDSNYQWYDYENYMWANAVTVREESSNNIITLSDGTTSNCTGENNVCMRDDYLNAPVGTVIPMDDITTMWVWIPRYKYSIFTNLNEPSNEQLIEVTFEHGIDSTGTVKCQDNILKASDSASSETCTDDVNGSIIKGFSTYTHPAFTFGNEELTGFWMAKFEMSTDDTTCINSKNATNCNKIGLNTLIKPSVDALSYQTISTEFANIRRMELTDNIHGFPQGENVTSHLDSNSYLTGELVNDSNKLDIHMQKNMEWGAVTYLSQSRYGKWNNSLYSGDSRRVYKNNYYTSTNYVYKTGYSSGKYNGNVSTSASITFLYNDMTVTAEGQGYRGAGASTTGTVYGVYDMNGGLYDYVMGNMVNSSGNFYPRSSGIWAISTSGNIPNTKYYDKYSYNTSSDSNESQSRGKLGDGTKEATTTFGSQTGGWGGVYRYMPSSNYSWFARGGYASNSSYWGLFLLHRNNGSQNSNYGSRPVLVISHDLSWWNE